VAVYFARTPIPIQPHSGTNSKWDHVFGVALLVSVVELEAFIIPLTRACVTPIHRHSQ